jgi:hypothetical protein
MDVCAYQTHSPFKCLTKGIDTRIVSNVKLFEKEIKNEKATITDQYGGFVKLAPFIDIMHWWQENTNQKKSENKQITDVVHWPVTKRSSSSKIYLLIKNVNNWFIKYHPDLCCVLDKFNHRAIPSYTWLVLGRNNTVVKPHQDMFGTASWNLLTMGRKKWKFWHPKSNPNADIAEFQFTQLPGEFVWIPENWWHSVRYETSCLCTTKNIIPERSFKSILSQARKSDKHLTSVLEVIEKLNDKSNI